VANIKRGYADGPSGQIHYREAGSGEPLILLHRTPSSSALYERLMPYLAGQYRVIAMDTLGFGMSDPPLEPPARTLRPYTNGLIGLLDGLGIESAHMVGMSTGGSIAIEATVLFPERVKTLVLGQLMLIETAEELERFEGLVPPFGRRVEFDSQGSHIMWVVDHFRKHYPDADPDFLLTEVTAGLLSLPTSWQVHYALASLPGTGHSTADYLPQITRPTLFVNTAPGPLLYETTKRAHGYVPGAEYVEIEGGNTFNATAPEAYADAILAFLQRVNVRTI
jgi:pimeloyl-ACP methyl ester carboxylesterase